MTIKQTDNTSADKLESVLRCLARIDRAANYAEVSDRIRDLLGAIGAYTGASRVYIFERPETADTYTIAYEWLADGVPAPTKVLRALNAERDMPNWEKIFQQGHGIMIEDMERVRAAMPEEYAILTSQNIRTEFAVPVTSKRKVVGFIGINNPDVRRSAGYINLLEVVGGHLGSVWDNYRTDVLLKRGQHMLRATEKALEREQLFLEAFTRDYTSAFYIDLITGKGQALKLDRQANAWKLVNGREQEKVDYEPMIRLYAERFLPPESVPDFLSWVSLSHIRETLTERDRMSLRYRSLPNAAGQQYFELQIVCMRKTEQELMAIFGFRHIDDIVASEQKHQEELEHALAEARLNNEIISAISKIYSSILRIDIPHDHYDEVSGDTETHHLTGVKGRASVKMAELCDAFVMPEYHDRVLRFFDIFTLPERLAGEDTVAMEFLDKEGKWMHGRFIAKKRNADGTLTHVLYVSRSIDDAKRRERNWIAIAEEANRANAAKTDFLSRMAHDIRTPMNAVRGFTQIALENADNPAKMRESLERINLAGKYLQQLVDDVLDLSRIESGRMQICPAPTDIRELFGGFSGTIENVMPEKNLHFHCTLGELPCPVLMADSLRIRQVYMNLLSNAIKYTPEGGDVFFTLTEKPARGADTVVLCAVIRDTGIGMTEDFMKIMYQKFIRSVDTRVNTVRGSGLGLSIVRQLVELMGGTIGAVSEPGKGTAFTVEIPLPVAETSAAAQDHRAGAVNSCRGMHLLVAEDNELNFEVISALLLARGITCDRAEDGSVCVEKFRTAPHDTYDAILMDVMMPVMDGLQSAAMIRRLNHPRAAGIPIIAMTANAFSEDIKKSAAAGMNDHLTKPVDPDHLCEVLAAHCRSAGQKT